MLGATAARLGAAQASEGALAGALPPADTLWPMVQTRLQELAGERAYATWLKDLQPMPGQAADGTLRVAVATVFIKDFIEREYLPVLGQALQDVTGTAYVLDLVVAPAYAGTAPAAMPMQTLMTGGPQTVAPMAGAGAEPAVAGGWRDANTLDERYTFDTYVMGPSNTFAFAAAKRVAEEDGAVFNPFFLYGGVGLGKTHLMQAIGLAIKERKPEAKILYLSAEQFFMRFVRAMREKDTLDFKDVCRGADVLMVDDIQFIAGKDNTQEEFFHTFNELVTRGKKVILTADRSPHELANIEERLQSRLGSGLTVEIHAPEVETRLAILQKKAEERELELAPEVLQFLAQNIASNVRELEGALNRLLAFSKLTGNAMTVDFAREQLRDLLRVRVKHVSVEEIQQAVAELCNIRLADLVGPRRTKALAEARQMAMWLAKQLTSKSYPDIGRAFGGRDHTTVMHNVGVIEKQKATDPQLADNLRRLERTLTGR